MLEDYFEKTVCHERPFYSAPLGVVDLVVVIPAYAEKGHLFRTLRSLAENPAPDLEKTLVLCVINNEEHPPEAVRRNNAQTMKLLHDLIACRLSDCSGQRNEMGDDLRFIARSPMKIGYIDAASPGCEIPSRERGAGTARKIGMDMALRILWPNVGKRGLLVCLDADTTVMNNYLNSLRSHRSGADLEAFVIDYEHPWPEDLFLSQAICNYEIFLRWYVLGLKYAKSPYAYHVMGSAMAVTAGAYVAVRGMSRRPAGEDFYFLNKLAKVCPVTRIRDTRVFPAARISKRVSFGTGASVEKMLRGHDFSGKVYHPEAFRILARWLEVAEEIIRIRGADVKMLMSEARLIDSVLEGFLKERHFPPAWERICARTPLAEARLRRFHEWFDAFQTLKLIRALHRQAFTMISIEEAWEMMGKKITMYPLPPVRDRMEVLNFLRKI